MIRFIIRNFKNYKVYLALFISALIIVQTTLPISIYSIEHSIANVRSNITEHSRGKYDILVRPQGSRGQVEKRLGVVAENYLDGAQGGISIEEWEEIKKNKDIEIAAPVATIGYFTGITRSFSFQMPSTSSRFTTDFYTSNGLEEFKVGNTQQEIMIKQKPQSEFQDQFGRLANEEAFNYFQNRQSPTFLLPNTYHLLVGIDAESEEGLTGISFQSLNEGIDDSDKQKLQSTFGNAPILPVVKLIDPEVPIKASIKLETLDITEETTASLRNQYGFQDNEILAKYFGKTNYAQLYQHLATYPAIKTEEVLVDFSHAVKPFEYQSLLVDEHGELKPNNIYGIYSDQGKTSKYYVTSKVSYEISADNTLKVHKERVDGEIPKYRKVIEKGTTRSEASEVPFVLHPVGEYKIGDKESHLASSPLGIYQLEPTRRLKDENEIFSTIYPGSFVSSPAHGVTTLKAARIIKGNKPIDAIRIRVAGISAYDKMAEEKIKKVATDLAKDGYEIDIVAGASHQQIQVSVEGIGTVLEPWTTLGAATEILKGWNFASLLITLSFIIVSIIYLMNRLKYWNLEKLKELELLTQIGWNKKDIYKKFHLEFILILLTSYILGTIVLLIVQMNVGYSKITFATQLAVVTFIYFLFILKLFNLSVEKKTNLDNRSIKIVPLNKGTVHAFAKINLTYYRSYIIPPFIQLMVVSALATFVLLTIHETVHKTNLTFLGKYINTETSSFHGFIVCAAFILALTTTIESLMSAFKKREKEFKILKEIGWTHALIKKVLLAETFYWTGFSIILGMVISTFFYIVFFGFSITKILLTVGFTLSLIIIVMVISWLMIKKVLV